MSGDPTALIGMAFTLAAGVVSVAIWAQAIKSKVGELASDVNDHESRIRHLELGDASRNGYERGRRHRTSTTHRAVREDSTP